MLSLAQTKGLYDWWKSFLCLLMKRPERRKHPTAAEKTLWDEVKTQALDDDRI
jgi:hypothetical protein